MKAFDGSLERDSLWIGFARDMFDQLAQGKAVFMQDYGQTARQRCVGTGAVAGLKIRFRHQ